MHDDGGDRKREGEWRGWKESEWEKVEAENVGRESGDVDWRWEALTPRQRRARWG